MRVMATQPLGLWMSWLRQSPSHSTNKLDDEPKEEDADPKEEDDNEPTKTPNQPNSSKTINTPNPTQRPCFA
eukprot:jgi/Psemu1/24712/gm1.24712_g